MKVINVLSIVALFFVSSYSQSATIQSENDAKKYIGKTYTQLKELDPSLSEGGGMTIENATKYSVSVYGKKTLASNKKQQNILVFFEETIGYSGNTPKNKILDVLSIDLKNYKPGSEVRLNECTAQGKGNNYFTVAVYQLEAASKTKNGLKPQKAWHPDIKTGKFVEIPTDNLLCQTYNEED